MSNDELLKELIDPLMIRERFFKSIRAITSYHKAQKDASITGESPEYDKYDDNMSNTLASLSPEQEHILRIILNFNLAFFETIADNNQRLLSLIFPDSFHSGEGR